MSIRTRIDDAKILWENEHFEGAVVSIIIAFAATARKRYPRNQQYDDPTAFKSFIRDELRKITNGPTINVSFYYRGDNYRSIEDLIYIFIRCELIHEATLPNDIELTQPVFDPSVPIGRNPDGQPFEPGLGNHLILEDTLGFPIGWIWNMIRVIVEAPENSDLFRDYTCPIPDGYSFNAGFLLTYPDEHPERFPPNRP
jgi:hypothetical protein